MNTTSLLIELLISGLAFFITLVPIVAYGFNLKLQEVILKFSELLLPYQLLLIYALGIIWNRLCDEIFWVYEKKIIEKRFKDKENFTAAKIKVLMKENSPMIDYLGKIRSLLRITRITSVFTLIVLVEFPFLFHFGLLQLPTKQIFILVIVTLFLLFLSIYTWYRFQRSFVKVVFYAHIHLMNEENRNNSITQTRRNLE